MLSIDFSAYYSVDIESNLVVKQSSGQLDANIKNYITEHLVNIHQEEDIRKYSIKQNQSTQVLTCMNEILQTDAEESKFEYAQQIADRLLEKEVEAQAKINHLNNELQKGGLIVTHFTNENKKFFVIAKVHFIDVRMESNFEKGKATPEKEHMLKTVIIPVDNDSVTYTTQANYALVTDSTKSKGSLAATFWWKEFLELIVIITDEDNTNKAFNRIDGYLRKKFFDQDYKMDYFSSRNSLISYMKSSPSFTFNTAIDSILGDFSTLDYMSALPNEGKEAEKAKIIEEIKKLNKNKNDEIIFDGNFAIDKKAIKAKMKKVIKLDTSISLTLDDEIQNLRDKIVAGTDEKGNHIKIYSEQGYNEFK